MSKMSMPCIFPRISSRSNPVACSRSVGTVPGSAPGGSRSSIDLISSSRKIYRFSMSCVAERLIFKPFARGLERRLFRPIEGVWFGRLHARSNGIICPFFSPGLGSHLPAIW